MKRMILSAMMMLAPVWSLAGPQAVKPSEPVVGVEQPWIRLVPPVSGMTAAYFVLVNKGDRGDQLLSVSSSAFDSVEMHETVRENGKSRMQQLQKVELPKGERVAFVPGGKHLMLIGIKKPLIAGQQIPLEFSFGSGKQVIQARVQEDAPAAPATGHEGHHH